MIFKKRNFRFDIPDDKSADVTRVHALRNTIFTRTRIVILCVIMILALSVVGTLAYLNYTANQAANRFTVASDAHIQVIETTTYNGTTTTDKLFHSGTNNADAGEGNKKAGVKAVSEDGSGVAEELVRMTIVPEVEQLDPSDSTTVLGNAYLNENWSAPQQDSSNNWYIDCGLIRINLSSTWRTNFIYKDGSFIVNKTVNQDDAYKDLVTGVLWADSTANRSDYGKINVNIIADAISASTEGADMWGVVIGSDKSVSLKTS